MVNYQNGKIYKIEDINGEICYIGSTTKELLSKRMAEHRSKYKLFLDGEYERYTAFNIFHKYGVENCRIILIELYPCNTKDELTSRESHYIRTLECINKNIPNRTRKEWKAQPHNKEKTKNYNQIYNAKNKETKYTVIKCECGNNYTKSHRSCHMKTKKHLNALANQAVDI